MMTEDERRRFDSAIEMRFKVYNRSIKIWGLFYRFFLFILIVCIMAIIFTRNEIIAVDNYISPLLSKKNMIDTITGVLIGAIVLTVYETIRCLRRYRIFKTNRRDIEQLRISLLDYNADAKSILNELKRITAVYYGGYAGMAPDNLRATGTASTEVHFAWDAPADGWEVEGYRIYRDGIQVASSPSTSYIDRLLRPAKTYIYTVTAVYKGGQISAQSAPVLISTAPSAVKVSSGLSESFNENTLDPKRWRSFARPNSAYPNPNMAVATKNQRLEIMTTQGIAEGGCAGIYTVSPYDATESEVFVKLDDPGDQAKPGLEVYFDLRARDNAVRLVLSGNILTARKQLAGKWSDLSRIRYDASKMSWWRFQEKNGTLYWQYSGNAQDWKELHKARDPFSLSTVMVYLGARTLQPERGGAGTPSFDNLNILPASVSLSASPSTIAFGQSTTLTWSSTNAASCHASGGWDGPKALSGSADVSPKVSTTYTLACDGAGGTAEQSVRVIVHEVFLLTRVP